jgi:putative inorganic carbon (HCO3(-)) transporter
VLAGGTKGGRVDNKGVEGEALSNPSEASVSLSTWKAEKSAAKVRLKGAANWIAEHELWLLSVPVTLMLFSGRVPIWIIGASLSLIPIPWVCRRAAKGYLTVCTPMDLPIVILLSMALVGLYPSVDSSMSMPVLYKMIVEFALFYGLVNSFHSERRIWITVAVLLVAGAGASLLGLVGVEGIAYDFSAILGTHEDFVLQLVRRLNEAGFNANIVGGTLAMLFPLNLSLFCFGSKRLSRPLLAFSLLLIGATVLLTQSRGALVGLAVALVVMAIWRSRWFALLVPLALIGLFVVSQHLGVEQIVDFLLTTEATRSAQARFELWQRAIYMLQDFPFTGIGLGTFSRVATIMYPFFLLNPDAIVPHAHNLFLQAGVDLGIPGLVAFIAFLTAFSFTAVKSLRMAKGTELEPLAIGLLCGFVVYLSHGLLDYVTHSTKPGTAIWAIMGLTVALYRRHHKRDLTR